MADTESGPIAILLQEHREIELLMAGLEAMARTARDRQRLDRGAAERMIEILRRFVDRSHHGKEEHHLFHVMAGHGLPEEGFPTGVLHAEHHQGRTYIGRMAAALPSASAGEGGGRLRFMRAAFAYLSLLREHIPKEEETLFSIAEQALTGTERAQLLAVFHAIEEAELGEGRRERYRRWARELAHKGP